MKRFITEHIVYHFPKKAAHMFLWRAVRRRPAFDLDRPETYDEKIQWLMVNFYDSKYTLYADKLKVRDYIASLGLEDILVPLYGTWESAESIDFSGLPDSFVLMCNHASGPEFYEIIKSKADSDMSHIVKKFRAALKVSFATKNYEYHYAGIKPVIMCEELLTNGEDEYLTDYKVVCANGTPKAILVCSDRYEGRDYFDTRWGYLGFTKAEFRSRVRPQRPGRLEEMLDYAAEIAKPFPFARVDFYNIGGRIYFSEITLTPSGGFHDNLTEEGQRTLGSYIELDEAVNHAA